ncbi:MAG TPA: M23 family metallopeptidase [Pyrinomonadaceae bacterium]|nr:M23 family metallopeptidase [Pyrinomonadaceae bacterium]
MTRVSQKLTPIPPIPKGPRAFLRRHVTAKRSIIALVLSFAFLFVCGVTGAAGRMADKMILYVHLARLYSKTPDTRLSMPLKDVKKTQIANTWGAPRGDGRSHEGQDIFAPRGTPIYSATTGYVTKIGEDNLGGHTVSVIGDGGRKYYYAHLDSYAPNLEVGDYVTRQTVLGYVGSTGNADGTPPHLHFGIYTATGAIDPLPMLIDRPQEKPIAPKTDKRPARKR